MKRSKRQSDKATNKRSNMNLLDGDNKSNSKRNSESSSNMDCK